MERLRSALRGRRRAAAADAGGPVAFDVGVNLSPDREVNEQPANMHFSIGLF